MSQCLGRRAVVVSVFAALSAACGGDGTGAPASSDPPPSGGGNDPSSLEFVPGTSPRYLLIGLSSQTRGTLGSFSQREDGAMTELAANTLSGAEAEVQDIGSEPSRAQGRWTRGTVTTGQGTRTLPGGESNDVFHYLAYNQLETLPTKGSLECGEGLFSTPTFAERGPSSILVATTTGSATFTPSAKGVAIHLDLDLEANGGTASAAFDATVDDPNTTVITGDAFGTGQSSMIAVGDGGDGSFLVVAAYSAIVDGGVVYQGLASFRCK